MAFFRLMIAGFLAFVFSFCWTPALAEDFSGQVVGVLDGDTIVVMHGGSPQKIRLAEIDCPEKSQAFGQRAKQFTSEHAFRQEVTVHAQGLDRYGRTIGEVILPDGQSLNCLLIREGYAWWYKKYSHDTAKQQMQESARGMRLGLWSDSDPQAPWDYRKELRSSLH